MLYLLLLLIFLAKITGFFLAYNIHLPDRFPPETAMAKLGHFLFVVLDKIIHLVNEKIPLFPSGIVPLFESSPTKVLFLRLPFVLLDFVILIITFWLLAKKRKSIWFLLFSLINFWIIFYFNSQRLSFVEEFCKFFFKSFKMSAQGRYIIFCSLITVFLSLIIFTHILLGRRREYRIFLKKTREKINFKLIRNCLFVLLVIYLINSSGILLRFSSQSSINWESFWIKPSGNLDRTNVYYVFEKEFNLLFVPKEANIFSFCQGDYLLYVNGKLVGRGGLISDGNFAYYDYWPAAKFLKKGKNFLRLECYNPYLDTLSLVKKPPGMIFQLEARNKFFKKKVVSDSSWRALVDTRYLEKVEFMSITSGFQEFFDNLHKKPVWGKAQIIDRPPLTPWKNLVLRPIPFLQEQLVSPSKNPVYGFFSENPKVNSPDLARIIGDGIKEISGNCPLPYTPERKNSFLIFDFGKIVVGYPRLKIFSQAGGRIDFGFAETLKNDGSPDVAKMVSQADQLIFDKGDFSYSWRQRRAFRYAILIFNDFKQPVRFDEFSVEAVNYPADDKESFFITSDSELNRIFEVAKYTAKIARQGNFEDCPHRERAQYVGDMRIVSLVNYYNYSNKELIRKALWEFTLSQEKDGFIRAVYPAGRKLLIPDYSAQWVSASWEYYMYSGDLLFLKNIYPFLRKQIEGFINYSDQDGLVRNQNGWWIFIDQGDQEMNLDKSISLNIFYLEALKSIANAANELGDKADAANYEELGEDVSKLINDKAWNNKTGLYDDCITGNSMCDHFSRQTNYLALYQNIVDPKKLNVLKFNLLNNHSLLNIITPYFNTFVVEALFKNKFNDEAINLVRNYWGGMIKNGATTFWETYDTKTGKENTAYGESLSHGWSSGPAYLLPKWILGVEPLEPGYLSFRVEPIFVDLNYAKGKIPIDHEKSIEVSWKKEGHLEVNIRYNFPAKAEISLPYHGEKMTVINNNQIKDLKHEESKVKFWIDKPGDYKIVLSD